MKLLCPVCFGSRANTTLEGPQTCYACCGEAEVSKEKFVDLLRTDTAPSEVFYILKVALDRLERDLKHTSP